MRGKEMDILSQASKEMTFGVSRKDITSICLLFIHSHTPGKEVSAREKGKRPH